MFLSESFGSLMSRDWKRGAHGKEHSEAQHKKRKKSGRWKLCNIRAKIKPKLRWNKKKGKLEKTKKHSKLIEIVWAK